MCFGAFTQWSQGATAIIDTMQFDDGRLPVVRIYATDGAMWSVGHNAFDPVPVVATGDGRFSTSLGSHLTGLTFEEPTELQVPPELFVEPAVRAVLIH